MRVGLIVGISNCEGCVTLDHLTSAVDGIKIIDTLHGQVVGATEAW